MKKLLSALVLFGFLCSATISYAKCPLVKDCDRPMPPKEGCHNMMPKRPCDIDECRKFKKCDMEKLAKRLCLNVEQKDKAQKIKARKQRRLDRINSKIRNYEEKIMEKRHKKMEIKRQAMQDFEAILTDKQKCEFQKMREEHRAEMKKYMSEKCPCQKTCPKRKDCPMFNKKPCDMKPCDKPCEKPCK